MLALDDLIQQANELKPLPASAVRLAALTSSNHTDLGEVAEVVAFDQALAMRLLRAANSAASGGTMRVSHPQDAVFRLGTGRVLALAIAAGARDLLNRDVSAYGLDEGRLWQHSIATAAAAESITEFAEGDIPAETFAAALLHDVGKLVMGRHLSTEDLDWIRRAQTNGGRTPLEAEREVLGVHHGELGGIIAQHWEMPQRMVEGIIYHHDPANGFDVVCDAVCLANLVARHLETGAALEPAKDSLDRLGVLESSLDQIVTASRSRFESVRARYNAV